MPFRLLPPAASGNPATITVNGRYYSCAIGSALDNVPDCDAFIMQANGWIAAADGGSGVTAARPSNPNEGDEFFDATLGFTVVFNGGVWVNKDTGVPA